MNFTTYLIKQLTDIVDVYRKYLKTTYATCLAMTVCCFVIMAFLVGFGDLPQLFSNKQPDLITYFLTRYSTKDTYRLVDLSKIILLFFISLLSMSISKFENMENLEEKKRKISLNFTTDNIFPLLVIFLVCIGIDYGLTKIENLFDFTVNHTIRWFYYIIFLFRIYIPLFLFSMMIYQLKTEGYPKITIKKLLFLFAAFWLFNEFAIELAAFVRSHIIGFILLPYGDRNTCVEESLLSIPIVAFWFLGYHSVMNSSFVIMEEMDTTSLDDENPADIPEQNEDDESDVI